MSDIDTVMDLPGPSLTAGELETVYPMDKGSHGLHHRNKDLHVGLGGIDVPYDQGALPEYRVLDMSKPQTTSYRFVFP